MEEEGKVRTKKKEIDLQYIFFQEPDDLFETLSQALLNAVDRDALSGWGAVVHVM